MDLEKKRQKVLKEAEIALLERIKVSSEKDMDASTYNWAKAYEIIRELRKKETTKE